MDFFVYLGLAFSGLVAHWYKRYARGQTRSTFWVYMRGHRKHTAASMGAIVTGVFGMFVTGDAVALSAQTAGAAFMLGYTLDSTINKDVGNG